MSNFFSLFSVLGLEIEYMLVNKNNLNVEAKSDVILKDLAGKQVNEFSFGEVSISNELVLHVLELKNDLPKPIEYDFVKNFQQVLKRLQEYLDKYNITLLPTGAHPWMDPEMETRRWPHDNHEIYQQYHSIFNCAGHGWSNLQSMHVNLPFANDQEFYLLHNSLRLLLPILPGLAASSPILDGKFTGFLDARLNFYGNNQIKIPSISGNVIPEEINSEKQYNEQILLPMYNEIAPFDRNGILQEEWLNSRAAIAKFERKAIEIRILDTQECVAADFAIAKIIFIILKNWCINNPEAFLDYNYPLIGLKNLYEKVIKNGLNVEIDDKKLLSLWQITPKTMKIREVWSLLIEKVSNKLDHTSQLILENILKYGSLSERILKSLTHFNKAELLLVYKKLNHCLLNNQQFLKL